MLIVKINDNASRYILIIMMLYVIFLFPKTITGNIYVIYKILSIIYQHLCGGCIIYKFYRAN